MLTTTPQMDETSLLRAALEAKHGPCIMSIDPSDKRCLILCLTAYQNFVIYIWRERKGGITDCYYVHRQDLEDANHDHAEYRASMEQKSYRMLRRYNEGGLVEVATRYIADAVENMISHPLIGYVRAMTFGEATWQVKNIPTFSTRRRHDE